MSKDVRFEGSRTREQLVDELLEQITPRKVRAEGLSNTTVESPLSELQRHLDEGQRRIELTYNKLEKSFQQLAELNTAREAERKKDLDFLHSLESALDTLESQQHQKRMDYLEEVAEKFLKTQQLWFLKEVTSNIEEPDIILDCRLVHDLKTDDTVKAHLVALGFHAVYSLHPSDYRRHIYAAPAEMVQILNYRAAIHHHKWYKNVFDQVTFRAMKEKCGAIISLWKKHVDSIKAYPDDDDEAKAAQLADYPVEEIRAEIAELNKMQQLWEKSESVIQFSRAQYHGLLSYYHASYPGEPEAEFYLRNAYVIIATVTVMVWLCVYLSNN